MSIATVSRVINGKGKTSPETRARVEAVIAEMDYRMNVLGRNLRTSESRLLLTMVPDIGNPFYAEIVRGIEGIAREHGYNVLLCDTASSPADERTYLDMLYNKLADGAICLDPEATQATTAAETGSLNWVACCEFDPDGHVPYVGIDNRAAAFDAVSCLISKCRRRIAIINSDERYMYARMRRQGYLDALTRAGLSAPEGCLIHAPGITFDDGRAAARQLMALATLPDAVFAVSDTLAIGVMHEFQICGYAVPERDAVMGFDNVGLCTVVQPELTTVAQPMGQLGEAAVKLLLKRLEDPSAPVEGILLKHELMLRGSA